MFNSTFIYNKTSLFLFFTKNIVDTLADLLQTEAMGALKTIIFWKKRGSKTS